MKSSPKGLEAYKSESRKSPLKKKEKGKNSPDSGPVLSAPDTSPRFIKTSIPPGDKRPQGHKAGRKEAGLSGNRGSSHAARLLLLLGKEEAARVLGTMSEKEIEQVTAEIARIQSVGKDEALEILQEFGHRLNLKGEGHGGIDTAREFLKTAFGDEKAEHYIKKAVPESLVRPFAFMNDLTLPQILQILKEEPEQSCSVVLSFLNASVVSGYLKSQNPASRIKLIRMMAKKRELDPEILRTMEHILQEKAHHIRKQEDIEIDGKDRLTEILRHMNRASEKHILEDLKEGHPDLSLEIRERLHTIDCIFNMRDRDLENLLLEMDNERIAFILKGKDDRVKERIMNSLSSHRELMVEESMILSPRVSRHEVEKETRIFLDLIRQREEEGSYILLKDDGDEFI